MGNKALKVYFAGELFDCKHLIGNSLIAASVNRLSAGRWKIILPQDNEVAVNRAVDIRDQDFKLLFSCDAAIFNFEGTDIDSGTAVEFIMAKMLDLPSVAFRSDFRKSGDQEDGDPWNLMCSGYPRTTTLQVNAMMEYKKALKQYPDEPLEAVKNLCDFLAEKLIDALEEVYARPALLKDRPELKKAITGWAAEFPGGSLRDIL